MAFACGVCTRGLVRVSAVALLTLGCGNGASSSSQSNPEDASAPPTDSAAATNDATMMADGAVEDSGGAADGADAADAPPGDRTRDAGAPVAVTLWQWPYVDGAVPTLPWGLAVDATDVYWTNLQRATGAPVVVKCAIGGCGGQPTTVVPEQSTFYGANNIALDATTVYFTSQGNVASVMTCPKSGCVGAPTVLATKQTYPAAMAVDGTNVYWVNAGIAGNDGAVMKCAIGGCGGTPTALASGQNSPSGIALDAENVYWTNFGDGNGTPTTSAVLKCAIAGCGGAPTVVASGQMPVALALAGKTLYWENAFTTYYHTDVIVASDVGGGGTTVIVARPDPTSAVQRPLGGIATDGTSVYWAFGDVWKAPASAGPADGGGAYTVPGATADDSTRIVVNATSVFWTDSAGERVMQLTPK